MLLRITKAGTTSYSTALAFSLGSSQVMVYSMSNVPETPAQHHLLWKSPCLILASASYILCTLDLLETLAQWSSGPRGDQIRDHHLQTSADDKP